MMRIIGILRHPCYPFRRRMKGVPLKETSDNILPKVDISDDDIVEAMKDLRGYLDITTGDFKELYRLAYRHAYDRITRHMKARDVMTKEVFTVTGDMPLREVAALMAEKGVAGVPVLDARGAVAGVISEKDFLSRMGGEGARGFMGLVAECLKGKGCVAVAVRAQKAEDIMSSPAITVGEDVPVIEIAGLFTAKKINRVPVLDTEGKLKGIVSRADIVRASGINRA